jgi:hypothetical protein
MQLAVVECPVASARATCPPPICNAPANATPAAARRRNRLLIIGSLLSADRHSTVPHRQGVRLLHGGPGSGTSCGRVVAILTTSPSNRREAKGDRKGRKMDRKDY